ncbi:Thymidylate kinase [Desulfovibrionales bacterium]
MMFLSFEGIEGAGKTSVVRSLKEYLEDRGYRVLVTREPGGSQLGLTLRTVLLDLNNTDISKEAELFLYLADRAQHVSQVIRPALDEEYIVLCDRYADSTVVYQGFGRGLDLGRLHAMNDLAVAGLWPDATFLLDVNPCMGLSRAMTRHNLNNTNKSEGRFEAESPDFHTRVCKGYLYWAQQNRERFRVVDATHPMETVLAEVRRIVYNILTVQK